MSDLSDLSRLVMTFWRFQPTGTNLFIKIFLTFEQNNTESAVLEAQHKKKLDHGLRVDILAPAQYAINDNGIRKYISETNKGK
jgi:hypothetical protein